MFNDSLDIYRTVSKLQRVQESPEAEVWKLDVIMEAHKSHKERIIWFRVSC